MTSEEKTVLRTVLEQKAPSGNASFAQWLQMSVFRKFLVQATPVPSVSRTLSRKAHGWDAR